MTVLVSEWTFYGFCPSEPDSQDSQGLMKPESSRLPLCPRHKIFGRSIRTSNVPESTGLKSFRRKVLFIYFAVPHAPGEKIPFMPRAPLFSSASRLVSGHITGSA
jgi:hypothetical protein